MGDAVTAAIGSVIMFGFVWMIASKLNEASLWLVCAIGIVLMLWAFWQDDWELLFKRDSNKS